MSVSNFVYRFIGRLGICRHICRLVISGLHINCLISRACHSLTIGHFHSNNSICRRDVEEHTDGLDGAFLVVVLATVVFFADILTAVLILVGFSFRRFVLSLIIGMLGHAVGPFFVLYGLFILFFLIRVVIGILFDVSIV